MRQKKFHYLIVVIQQKLAKKLNEFKNEFSIMIKGNQCPEIIQTYGAIQRRDKLILIMEYAANGSLRDYLNEHRSTPLSKDLVYSLVCDIALGNELLVFTQRRTS